MSQNQSYFWQTTKRNVYLKRSAKLQMLLALIAVMTFATICRAEIEPRNNDDNDVSLSAPTRMAADDGKLLKNMFDSADVLENNDMDAALPTKNTKTEAVHTGFLDGFTASISVILFTELGDKTFFIAAIMAMRHPRLIVFVGAITALALMTVLSVVFGMAATIIPKIYTYYISTALFAIFGLKMIYDGYMMKDSDAQEELEEVQSDLRKREDELIRATRGKYEENDLKRKNSNSDKEDDNSTEMGENGAGATTNIVTTTTTILPPTVKHAEDMQHRQRKPNNHNNKTKNHDNNNKKIKTNINKANKLDCDSSNDMDKSTNIVFHSSPALSQRTTHTNLEVTPIHQNSYGVRNGAFVLNHTDAPTIDHQNILVHSATLPTALEFSALHENNNNNNCIEKMGNELIGNGGQAVDAAAGQQSIPADEINNKRLERDVTSALVKDPESGIVRKNSKKSATYLTTRVMMQAFTMTFLAEWGDRSQLTTIILGASKNAYGVVVGGILGHSICTGIAVVGGRMVATRISVRTVTILGGIVFLGFALYALIMKPDDI